MSTTTLRLAFLSLPLLVGCATSDATGDIPDVAPVRKFDSAGIDTSGNKDTSVEDTSVADTSPPCVPLTSEQRPCGRCGKQTRVCSPSGAWGEFSVCTGELTSTPCTIGEVQTNPCGNCGKQTDTCDPMTCEWTTGVCTGEGVCAEGDKEESSASCTVAGEVRTRVCNASCAWGGYSDCSLPKGWVALPTAPTALEGRYYHTGIWTGTDMIVWGGYGSYVSPTYNYLKNTGFAYNLASNAWKQIATAPSVLSSGRWQHTAVYGGGKMMIWGGLNSTSSSSSTYYKNDGAVYDPSTDTWSTTAMAIPSLSGRSGHGAVWSTTTNEMIVWGGMQYSSVYFNDGAAYDPATNTWTAIPTAPISARWKHTMVWTGTEVIIFGGYGSSGYLRDGARYDPKTKIWTKFPDPPVELDGRYEHVGVWSGKELLVWGGYGSTSVGGYYTRSDGARYTPGGSWTRFTPSMTDIFGSGTVAARQAAQAWFGGGKLFLWGGASSSTALTGAASYDPSTGAWTTVATTGAPTSRVRASVVWTGKEAIIFGGSNYTSGSTYYNDGVIYRP